MLTPDQFDDAVRGVLKNLAALENHVLAIGVDWQGPTKAFDAFTEARNYFEAKSLTAQVEKEGKA